LLLPVAAAAAAPVEERRAAIHRLVQETRRHCCLAQAKVSCLHRSVVVNSLRLHVAFQRFHRPLTSPSSLSRRLACKSSVCCSLCSIVYTPLWQHWVHAGRTASLVGGWCMGGLKAQRGWERGGGAGSIFTHAGKACDATRPSLGIWQAGNLQAHAGVLVLEVSEVLLCVEEEHPQEQLHARQHPCQPGIVNAQGQTSTITVQTVVHLQAQQREIYTIMRVIKV
jgi:hypothetical protein